MGFRIQQPYRENHIDTFLTPKLIFMLIVLTGAFSYEGMPLGTKIPTKKQSTKESWPMAVAACSPEFLPMDGETMAIHHRDRDDTLVNPWFF